MQPGLPSPQQQYINEVYNEERERCLWRGGCESEIYYHIIAMTTKCGGGGGGKERGMKCIVWCEV